jgi:hypothetical protein
MKHGLPNMKKRCQPFVALILTFSLVGLAACSSISFFPKATAQKAADKLIDDIWPTSATPSDTAVPAVAAKTPTDAAKSEVKK